MIRTIARRLYPFLLVFGLLYVLAPSPANAVLGIGPDCKEAPIPEAPGGGISGFLGGAPANLPSDASGTFVDGAPSYSHYGLAGLTFNTYDLGCGPDAVRDPGAIIGTTIANWGLEGTKFGVSLTNAVMGAAYNPDYLQVFDPLLTSATGTLQDSIFDVWVPVVIVVVGVTLVWSSRKSQWSKTAATVGWALLVMLLAAAVFRWPVAAGTVADDSMTTVLGSVNAGINGTDPGDDPVEGASQALTSTVLWEQWKMGTFGRSNSATADKYAEDVYRATTLTWQEAQDVRNGDDGIIEQKADDFKEIASQIEEDDPDAYEYLTGHKGQGRIAAAMVSAFAMLCVAPFLLMGSLLLIGAYLIIRMAVVFFPVIATIGIAYQFRGAVKGVGSVVAAAVINSVMFGVGIAVTMLAVRILLRPSSGLPLWLSLVLMAVLTFIMWVAMKPLRKLTVMANPSRMFGDAAGSFGKVGDSVKGAAGDIAKGVVAAYGGAAAAIATSELVDDDDKEGEGKPTAAQSNRSENYSATATVVPSASPAPAGLPAGTGDRSTGLQDAGTPPVGPIPGGSPAQPQAGYAGRHSLDVGSLPAPAPTEGESEAVRHDSIAAATSETPRTTYAESTVFVPAAEHLDGAPGEALPSVTEPSIDEDGTAVYTLFRPDSADTGSAQ